MSVEVLFRVRRKPSDMNYEVLTSRPDGSELRFRASLRDLTLFLKRLRGTKDCTLGGSEGESLVIRGGDKITRAKLAEYLELVLEGEE